MAAEVAVPLIDDTMAKLDAGIERLIQSVQRRFELKSVRLQELLRSYALGQVRNRVEASMQVLDFAVEKLHRSTREAMRNRATALSEKLTELEALNPRAILSRGYTICSDVATGAVLRSAAAAEKLEEMRVSFHDGHLRAEIKERINGKE